MIDSVVIACCEGLSVILPGLLKFPLLLNYYLPGNFSFYDPEHLGPICSLILVQETEHLVRFSHQTKGRRPFETGLAFVQ